MIENILRDKPGGERVITEYNRTKSLTDTRRRDMVKILVAHMASEHGYVVIYTLRTQYTFLVLFSRKPQKYFYKHPLCVCVCACVCATAL